MNTIDSVEIEQDLIKIVKRTCEQLSIEQDVSVDFCPGNFIMSQILVSIIPEIEIITGMKIPLDCYIFYDNNKNKEQLTIRAAVQKLLKLVKHEQ